jgi:cell division inhibitor SepF
MALKDAWNNLFPQPDPNIADTEKNSYVEDASSGNKMILVEPRAYSESTQIADHLKRRNSVVVNLKRVTADQAKRIVDFLSGTLYAIGGDLQKLGNGIFLCTPSNVNVEGRMSDDEESKKGKAKIEDDFEF